METAEGKIVRSELGGVDAFYFVPADFKNRNVCSPAIFVYDDGKHTLESAAALIKSSGLAKFAQEVQATVVVFNPLGEKGWSKEDVKAFGTVFGNYTDNSGTQFVDGLSVAAESRFGPTPAGKYPGAVTGSTIMLYLVGAGKGAQFIIDHLANSRNSIPGMWGNQTIPTTPTGVVLFGAQHAPDVASVTPIIAALYGCSDEVYEYFSQVNDKDEYTWTGNGPFGAKAVAEGLKFVGRYYRYGTGANLIELLKVPDYQALGITQTVGTRTISTGEIEYYMYIPDTADMSKKGSVPVLLLFHGGGNSAEFIAWSTAYPEVGKKDGLAVVSVNHHVERSAAEIMELVDLLFAEFPAFDAGRVYASGFSMGSAKTQELAAQFGDRIAAVAPHSGSFGFESSGVPVPMFYIGGEESPLPELPHQSGEENQIDRFVKGVCAWNGHAYAGFDAAAGNRYGLHADKVESAESADGLHVMTKVIFNGADGKPFTVFASTSRMTHSTLRFNAEQSWAFMRRFSRT